MNSTTFRTLLNLFHGEEQCEQENSQLSLFENNYSSATLYEAENDNVTPTFNQTKKESSGSQKVEINLKVQQDCSPTKNQKENDVVKEIPKEDNSILESESEKKVEITSQNVVDKVKNGVSLKSFSDTLFPVESDDLKDLEFMKEIANLKMENQKLKDQFSLIEEERLSYSRKISALFSNKESKLIKKIAGLEDEVNLAKLQLEQHKIQTSYFIKSIERKLSSPLLLVETDPLLNLEKNLYHIIDENNEYTSKIKKLQEYENLLILENKIAEKSTTKLFDDLFHHINGGEIKKELLVQTLTEILANYMKVYKDLGAKSHSLEQQTANNASIKKFFINALAKKDEQVDLICKYNDALFEIARLTELVKMK